MTKGLHKGHALRGDEYAAKSLVEGSTIFDTYFDAAVSEELSA